jgi:deoxyribonuclease V
MYKNGVDFRQIKEIEKKILDGIKLDGSLENAKTLAAFDVSYVGKKYLAVAVVYDIATQNEIERKIITGDELMLYSPALIAFREGPAIVQAYKELENIPDILIVKGNGAVHPRKVGLASYVGIILNKPCIGVTKDLLYGRLEEDKILFDNDLKGYAIKTKEFANPIYVMPGYLVGFESAVEFVKKLIIEPYKMPYPLHFAHKYVNKMKKEKKEQQ